MSASDPYDLRRFVVAQDADDTYHEALAELRNGRKTGHWMWFVFPQLPLGRTEMAQRFAITGRSQAEAYLAHTILGPRLVEASEMMLSVQGRTALQILGVVDSRKLKSCATLFANVSRPGSVFHRILATYYDGVQDELTLGILQTAE